MKNKLFYWLLSILFLIGGSYSIYWGVDQDNLAHSSKNWPSVKGKITSSYIKKIRGKGGFSYFSQVKYRYVVNGEQFENDKVYFGAVSPREDDALATMEKYPEGKAIFVYYNPKSIGISCLEPGKYREISSASIVLGVLSFVLGILMLMVNLVMLGVRRSTVNN